jgi:hypothetical protein
VDPLVAATGTPYAFTGGDPVNGSDPDGLRAVGKAALSIGAGCDIEMAWCRARQGHLTWGQGALILGVGLGSLACLGLCDAAAAAIGGSSGLTWLSENAGSAGSDLPSLSEEEQQTYDDVCDNANNFAHVFAEKHDFGGLVEEFGSQHNVLEQIIYSLREASLPQSGTYNVVVQVGNSSVNVRGAVVSGITRISTAWVLK